MRKHYYRARLTGKLDGYVAPPEQVRDESEIDALNHGPQKRFAGWAIGLFLFFALFQHWAALRFAIIYSAASP